MKQVSPRQDVVVTLAMGVQARVAQHSSMIEAIAIRDAVEQFANAGDLQATENELVEACNQLEKSLLTGASIRIRVQMLRDGISAYQSDFGDVRQASIAARFLAAAGTAKEVASETDVVRYVSSKMTVRAFAVSVQPSVEVTPVGADSAAGDPEVLPAFAMRFDDGEIYTILVKTKLLLFLPATSYRPEAMRVTERKSAHSIRYSVETYNPRLDHWIVQKNHVEEAAAMTDACGWYPTPLSL